MSQTSNPKRRHDHEPPAAIAEMGWRYHHVGIPTRDPKPNEQYIHQYGIYVAGFSTSPYGIEWMRFTQNSPVHELIKSLPHVAFEVDDIDAALQGKEIINGVSSPSPGVKAAMIVENGAPVEFIQFCGARKRWKYWLTRWFPGRRSRRSAGISSIVMFLLLTGFPDPARAGSDPVADPKAQVVTGNARFTVLTPQLIRMEWADSGRFEDHASLVFLNRHLSVPSFVSGFNGDTLVIRTEKLLVRYASKEGRFNADNLQVTFNLNGQSMTWHPGMNDRGNLSGTTRTLDGVKGATALEGGLLSRDGWVVIDDGERPLFDSSDWPWVMPRRPSNRQDIYFFGYGHEYRRALFDFTSIAGRIPMPPRFAFGLWWSRYWAYTDEELQGLVNEFRVHDVPLDVLVIDMDWHLTFNLRWDSKKKDQAGELLGWTGYTWNRDFFPDPPAFLQWCDNKGLRTPLNLHPASGIQPHEEHYPDMARAMGMDPQTQRYVPFDIVDKKFALNYMSTIIRPLEMQGVDFWWLDWQQWHTTKIPGVTPTWWLNYVFFTSMERRDEERPLLFHRWGGLGNHRYQIGFSGDVITSWESLAFQPYFTATAANVGYGYWSHDIGGHMPGPVSPEMYTRWIQFGACSPILRTHATKNPLAERRIWAFSNDDFMRMRDAIVFRYAMIPYIYTAARMAYESGVSICRPLYYDNPEDDEAYTFNGEYYFGNDVIAAPVTDSLSPPTMLASKKIWLPRGWWYEWPTGDLLKGPAVFDRSFAIDEIPLYVRAGAILPMQPPMKNSHERPVDPLILNIFPGDSGATRIYEDQGNSLGYQHGEFAWTTVRHTGSDDGMLRIDISPAEGDYPGLPAERRYEIRLQGFWPPRGVSCNGTDIPCRAEGRSEGWRLDGEKMITIVSLTPHKVHEHLSIVIQLPTDSSRTLLNGFAGRLARLRRVMTLFDAQWSKEYSPDILVKVVQTGDRITLDPRRAHSELEQFQSAIPSVMSAISGMGIDAAVKARALSHLATGR